MKRHKKDKKAETARKKFPVYIYVIIGLAVVLLAAGIYLLFYKATAPSLYVYPENLKQGDTVFIRVISGANEITGNLGQNRLVFYKKGSSNEWVSFLGIDVDQKPGNYTIYVDTSKAEHLTKEVKVALADFSSAPVVAAPSEKQTGYSNESAINNLVKKDNPAINKVLGDFTAAPYFTGPFSFPLSTMEKSGLSFGEFIGFGKYRIQHFGVDLKAPEKTDVYAVNDGKVVLAADLSNYGKTVIIDHGLDIFSMYLHLEEFKVSEGQMVKRGQEIGLSGDTGYATAPHLHLSIRVGGSKVDPLEFIEATKKIDDNLFLANISNILKIK